MPTVQFVDEIHGVRITKQMFPPKKVDRIEYWFIEALKTIPEIPRPSRDNYEIINTQMSLKWLTWTLTSPKGERVYVTIDRQARSFG